MERTEVETNVNEESQEEYIREHTSIIDFKMITFSLAEKDYAIDIMKVKEIAKANNFTYVPNTAPFVLGVPILAFLASALRSATANDLNVASMM